MSMMPVGKPVIKTTNLQPQALRRPRAAFLVGCGRSGTNMITRRLATSPAVALFNEDHPDAFIKYHLRDLPVIQRLVEQSASQIVLFKPILDTHLSSRLLARFPDAGLLFAFRHYADVINSSVRRFGPMRWTKSVARWIRDDFAKFADAPPPQITKERIQKSWRPELSPESAIALYWLFFNSLFFDLGLNEHPRVMAVQYERAVSEPEQAFKALAAFLQIPYTLAMVQGIYSSSIRKAARPNIDRQIELECEALWQRLCLASGPNSPQ